MLSFIYSLVCDVEKGLPKAKTEKKIEFQLYVWTPHTSLDGFSSSIYSLNIDDENTFLTALLGILN